MCWQCEPGGFGRKTCDVCGVGSRAHVVVCMATGTSDDFPFTETALCKACFEKMRFAPAMQHNAETRALAGVAT